MRIQDSIKSFDSGIGKVLPPAETFRAAREKISKMSPPILDTFFEVQRPSGIPQYTFVGSARYLEATSHSCAYGKGHTRDQALASGIMELVERYSCYGFLDSREKSKIASFRTMLNDDGLFQKQDFLSTFFKNIAEDVPFGEEIIDARIRWYEGFTLRGEKLYLPASLSSRFLHGSNGMASGNSFEEALLQGVCEVIERQCKTLVFVDRKETPLIDISTIDHPAARTLISKFLALGQELFIRDFSFGMGVPVVGVVRPVDGDFCHITAGAATGRDEALIRALVENSQMEHENNKFPIAQNRQLFRTSEVLSMKDLPQLKNKNIRIELENLEEILRRQNMKVYFHDARDKEINIPASIAIITRCSHIFRKPSLTNFLVAVLQDHMDSLRYDEAMSWMDRFETIDKNNQAIYGYFRGSVFLCQNRFHEATGSYESVLAKIRADRLQAACLVNCGIGYQALGRKDKALGCFVKAAEKCPDFRIEYIDFYRSIKQSRNERLKEALVQAKALYEDVLWKKNVYNPLYVFTVGENDKIVVTDKDVVDYLKITGQFRSIKREVMERQIAREEARRIGLTVTEQELRTAADAFRLSNSLGETGDIEGWLKTSGLSRETFEEYLETGLLVSKFRDHLVRRTARAECLSFPKVRESLREMVYKNWLEKRLK